MGTYATLSVGNLEVAWSKNEYLLSHSELYQEEDLKRREVEDCESELPEEWYEQKLTFIKDRLDLLGYTLERAKVEYENPSQFSDYDPLPFSFDEIFTILKGINLNDVTGEYSEKFERGIFAPNHIQEYLVNNRNVKFLPGHWDLDAMLENFSPYSQLRILAESPYNKELPVIWDFDGVVRNGWIERSNITHGTDSKFLIVTEGTSDSKIIKKSIELLRPHIKDLFTFVDMHEGYPFTGTGNLFNFVKGLSSIGVKNDIVVVFDNDAEGVIAMQRCLNINLPKNLKIIKLPDLDQFLHFPTVGPNEKSLSDINGKAASIECYLDIASEAEVRWTNYREDIKSYQGSLIAKDKYKRVFLKQQTRVDYYDYSKISKVIDEIISACIAIKST